MVCSSTVSSVPDTVPLRILLSIPAMLSVHSEQLHKTGFPTVHALILLEGTMNLTGEVQPLVEQLMMVKRMQVSMAKRGGWPSGQEGKNLVLERNRFPLESSVDRKGLFCHPTSGSWF